MESGWFAAGPVVVMPGGRPTDQTDDAFYLHGDGSFVISITPSPIGLNFEVKNCDLEDLVRPANKHALDLLSDSNDQMLKRFFRIQKQSMMHLNDFVGLYAHFLERLVLARDAEQSPSDMRKAFQAEREDIYQKLVMRDGASCRICAADEELTVDHDVPISKGGTNDLENLLIVCKTCNSRKGNRPYIRAVT